jgi:hypothetical protein
MILPRTPLRLLALALALAACGEAEPPETPVEEAPPVRPAPDPEPSAPSAAGPSAESVALQLYYRRLQADLVGRGLLRRDGGGADTPFTDTMLARNFVDIALFDEYGPGSSPAAPGVPVPSRLRRWEQPVRMSVEFGASVPEAARSADRAEVAAYAGRLARLTGLSIAQAAPEAANFHVLVLSEDDRLGYEARLRALVPGISDSSLRTMLSLPRTTLCLVVAFGESEDSTYDRAVALIRAEHPAVLRSACIHEEIAQGLGLANDSPLARPSIFNDDEEFALLTGHDELLLRMLYDPRFRTGMTIEEAEPVAREVARELLEGGTG